MHLREVYGEKAAKENYTCLFYHAKTIAVGNVTFIDNTFRITPA